LRFKDVQQFLVAANELRGALEASGISGARIGARGSSVTGASAARGVSFGPASDVDIFVEAEYFYGRYRASKNIPGFIHPDKLMRDQPLLREWSERWTEVLGRDVSIGGFVPGMFPGQPAIMVK